MQIRFTLTTEIPTYCVGLFDTRAEAEAFMEASALGSNGVAVTPVFYCDPPAGHTG